ncbi:MAG TPA: HEAT repeat domain-containing protein [candidate division WOR-3 bacterium]|uniref:HEAT repeat domain-containing protein n=1 Tax=candidate division WOR-3 bacterium TaxID=2052148 RepID=A0A7V5HN43_UNCW3|nr:HEAT repeat domain-containing protein [candidate division WOR-3 bacterium]
MPTKDKSRDPVEQMLKSKNILERMDAVEILQRRGDKEKILELIYSESWHLRQKAQEALISFGESIIEMVRPLLNEKFWYVRSAAINILGEVGDTESFSKIKTFLKEKNETVRNNAALALIKLLKKDDKLKEQLDKDERILTENILKNLKEFELLEVLRTE